jgi:hypothetical protein
MPTAIVGLHAALAAAVALFGLTFLLDPCGGGGDLCLGGVVGLSTLGVAGLVLAGLAVWKAAHRAVLLLVLDSVCAAVAWYIVSRGADIRVPFVLLGCQVVLALAVLGSVLAGRAVVRHRIETVSAVAFLVGTALFLRFMEVELIVTGIAGLVVGFLLERNASGATAPAPPPTQAG